ncbi:FtsL-like putative cell division protein [Mariniflexile jejuense]|uniref:FtsL-like putative cell division protein n=1 Tax=Mariniflexile jejuense TaxID=1173582 RepID=A0ABW3JF95_9FLAO
MMPTNFFSTISLISQKDIVTVLIVVVAFFSLLLILGIRKSYKLKKENEQLDKISEELAKQEEEYKDFTDGHMYGGN